MALINGYGYNQGVNPTSGEVEYDVTHVPHVYVCISIYGSLNTYTHHKGLLPKKTVAVLNIVSSI